ncbi:MAG: SDR family NAD(P)-dependent oxidoreductase [Fimbriimonadaceae bacterium]
MKRYIVIGASSGIGHEVARLLIARGEKVAAVARRVERMPEGALVFGHDVRDFEAIPGLFQGICHQLGGLDGIIYCSGVMHLVEPNEFNFEKDHEMIEVNVSGAIAWLNQAATRFQNVGAGTIVAIGSVAGERGRQGQPVYNASKAALATYMEALRNRLSRHGVKVVTIKPGPTETEMTAGLGLKKMMPVSLAAELILKKMERNGEHFLNPIHRLIFLVIRNIPSPIFRKLKL